MKKSTAISIRVDGELKEQSEKIMAELGLNMTTTVNMLLKQIVREKAIPLSLHIHPEHNLKDALIFSQIERMAGYSGTSGDVIADKMDAIIENADNG